jgi:hypothetical protein
MEAPEIPVLQEDALRALPDIPLFPAENVLPQFTFVETVIDSPKMALALIDVEDPSISGPAVEALPLDNVRPFTLHTLPILVEE